MPVHFSQRLLEVNQLLSPDRHQAFSPLHTFRIAQAHWEKEAGTFRELSRGLIVQKPRDGCPKFVRCMSAAENSLAIRRKATNCEAPEQNKGMAKNTNTAYVQL